MFIIEVIIVTVNLEKAIEASKNIMISDEQMSWRKPIFSSHAPGYFTTSEKIDAYLKKIDLSGKNALSVLSSGDHNFNLT